MPCTSSPIRVARTAVAAAGTTVRSHALPVAALSQRLGNLAQRPTPSRRPHGAGLTTLPAWSGGFRKLGSARC
jgi:hypothetical protein